MLSIRAMAEMGPWILLGVEDRIREREQCQRCSAWLRYVWVMEKQTAPKETWRIGSECGPSLEEMSKELWDATTKPFKTSIRHLGKLERLAALEIDHPEGRPQESELGWQYELGWAEKKRRAIAEGLTAQQRRVLGHQLNRAFNVYKSKVVRKPRS